MEHSSLSRTGITDLLVLVDFNLKTSEEREERRGGTNDEVCEDDEDIGAESSVDNCADSLDECC